MAGRFSPRELLHNIFGEGYACDIFLWKDKATSTVVLVVTHFTWVLFEFWEYSFVTFLSRTLMLLMFILAVWSIFGLPWNLPSVDDVMIPDSAWRDLQSRINMVIRTMYETSSGQDMRLLVQIFLALWIVSLLGRCVSFLTFVYLVIISLMTIPVGYEMYQDQMDETFGKIVQEYTKLMDILDTTILSKIPKKID